MNPVPKTRQERLKVVRQLVRDAKKEELPPIKSDINVTPLVDVVLVLLIIFMVVTPMIASGVAVDLPRTVHHARKPDEGKDIIISITQDKRLFVGANRVNRMEDLAKAVRNEKQKAPQKTVFLKGDSRAPYGTVRDAMEVLRESDIEDITLGTEEASKLE